MFFLKALVCECEFVVGSKIVSWFACVGEPATPRG